VLTDLSDFRAVSPAERRRKRSPLRDLAWTVRSFDFAAFKVLFDPAIVRDSDVEAARPWAAHWSSWTCASFLQAYLVATAGTTFASVDREASTVLFDAFRLERALYALKSAIDGGSTAVVIPMLEIARILGTGGPGA
jgi:maltose alpha-D-glucosyltransferase/alpha-amylase